MAGLSEFYSGPMLAPNRVGNTLVPAQIYSAPESVQQMYAGTPYAPAGSVNLGGAYTAAPTNGTASLISHTVTTVPIDAATGNPAVTAINAEVPHANTLGNDAARPNMRLTQENPQAAYANPPANYGAVQQPQTLTDLFKGLGMTGSALTSDGMVWQPATNQPGPGFTEKDRITPLAPTPGLVTGAPPSALTKMYTPAPPSAPTPEPGTSFLQARGVNTTNMPAPAIANALNDALAGNSHRGSFGV